MRIHTDKLERGDFIEAARDAGVMLVELDYKGSQSRKGAWVFYLSGSGRDGGQWGTRDHKTATWDEWGIFLKHLFDVDPAAHCGKNSYLSAEHYHWVTGGRFRTLTPGGQHLRHNWLSGEGGGRSVTGSYFVQSCKCGAVNRYMLHGHSFDELQVSA